MFVILKTNYFQMWIFYKIDFCTSAAVKQIEMVRLKFGKTISSILLIRYKFQWYGCMWIGHCHHWTVGHL